VIIGSTNWRIETGVANTIQRSYRLRQLKRYSIIRRAGKLRKATIRFVVSDRPHGNTRLTIGRFS